MNDQNITIPIKVERLKIWLCRALLIAAWLICFGLLATSVAVAVVGTAGWLATGCAVVLAAGLAGGVVLGLAGLWQLLRLLDQAVARLRG